MIKRNIKFIENYENREGDIIFIDNKCCITDSIAKTKEIHILPEKIEAPIMFTIKDFYQGYKRIHGAKHVFGIQNHRIVIYMKKNGSLVEEITIPYKEADLSILDITGEAIGHIHSRTLRNFNILEEMTTGLSYLKFLQHPTFILQNKELYFWGTDCIHQLRLEGVTSTNKNLAYHLSKSICKAISSFADGLYENIELTIQTRNHSSTLIFKGKNDIYVAPLIDTDEAYLCEYSKAREYVLSLEELKQLKELNLKKKNSSINKKTNAPFKVIIEVIDGIFYLQGGKIFEISKKVTVKKPIESYKFTKLLMNAVLMNADELYLSSEYFKMNDTVLIL